MKNSVVVVYLSISNKTESNINEEKEQIKSDFARAAPDVGLVFIRTNNSQTEVTMLPLENN